MKLPGPADPDTDLARAERQADRPGDVGLDTREVHLVAEAFRECRRRALAVVPRAVEAAIDGRLDAATGRLEQRERDEGRCGHGERLALGEPGQGRLQPDH